MKQGEAIRAYTAITNLNKQRLSGPTAKRVFTLFKALQPAWDFQRQEELKIFEAHPMYNPTINGVVADGNDEESQEKARAEVKKINEEIKAIENVDFDIDFEKFDFDLNTETVQITGEEIGNLESFINFI